VTHERDDGTEIIERFNANALGLGDVPHLERQVILAGDEDDAGGIVARVVKHAPHASTVFPRRPILKARSRVRVDADDVSRAHHQTLVLASPHLGCRRLDEF